MPDLVFLPEPALRSNPMVWLALLLLAGGLGGELAKRVLFLPRITGYAAAGAALGPYGFEFITMRVLQDLRLFADISIGLILFELGQRIDLRWLRRAPRLVLTSLAESGCAALLVYLTLHQGFGIEPLPAATAAAISLATSPAVVMRITADLGAQGQVTERTLLLTALNSSIAVLALTALIPWLYLEYGGHWTTIALHPLYLLGGSLLLGLSACALTLGVLRLVGRREQTQIVLLFALILAVVGSAVLLKLSVLLTLLAYGALLRNLDRAHVVSAADFGITGQIFFVVLFVLSGANLDLAAAWTGVALGAALAGARILGKTAGVMAFIPGSGLKARQGLCIALGLTPMSGFAVAMLQDTQTLFPEFGRSLYGLVVPAVVLLELAGPVLTQFAFQAAGEARPDRSSRT